MQSARKDGRTTAGQRKLCDDDMILLWLVKTRHSTPYQALEMFFGVSKDTARNYFKEVRSAFCKDVLDRLFYFPTKAEVVKGTPRDFAQSFPNIRFILDGIPLKTKLPQNFALNRLAWSSYKHYPCFLLVGGEWISVSVRLLCVVARISRIDIVISGISPNNYWCFRSALHGGLSAEVLTILNGSNLREALKGEKFGGWFQVSFGDDVLCQPWDMSWKEIWRRTSRF